MPKVLLDARRPIVRSQESRYVVQSVRVQFIYCDGAFFIICGSYGTFRAQLYESESESENSL